MMEREVSLNFMSCSSLLPCFQNFCRTIANLDIKLDFVPPAFINFVARQLVGSGFKLYKKVIFNRFHELMKFKSYHCLDVETISFAA